ncbi:RNA polymerase sigma factor [Oceanisphaera sp. W20_SRM_FM3]|uniref:RNA polymerase sigma factor n=1 Tax=Oceanisphaera sp. W20_SRM_FM3 TaxID=3240267 RepID=UPI003F9BF37A
MSRSKAEAPMPLVELTDANLLARARLGDGAAFELIVRRHNRALFRAARGVLDDESRAQEAVQEAYFSAFKHMDSYQERASLKTWLTRIVVNQAISIQRRQHSEVSLDEKVIFLAYSQSAGGQTMAPMDGHCSYGGSSPPEMAASQQEMKHLLEAAIRRLPETYRSVFMLRAVEGMSVIDSAFCLGLSENVVKKRLSRARVMLRKDLEQQAKSQASDTFEFAGKHCDAVTAHVMAELTRWGMIKPV